MPILKKITIFAAESLQYLKQAFRTSKLLG